MFKILQDITRRFQTSFRHGLISIASRRATPPIKDAGASIRSYAAAVSKTFRVEGFGIAFKPSDTPIAFALPARPPFPIPSRPTRVGSHWVPWREKNHIKADNQKQSRSLVWTHPRTADGCAKANWPKTRGPWVNKSEFRVLWAQLLSVLDTSQCTTRASLSARPRTEIIMSLNRPVSMPFLRRNVRDFQAARVGVVMRILQGAQDADVRVTTNRQNCQWPEKNPAPVFAYGGLDSVSRTCGPPGRRGHGRSRRLAKFGVPSRVKSAL